MPLKGIGRRIAGLWRRDIWRSTLQTDRSPKGWLCALLRIISISEPPSRRPRRPAAPRAPGASSTGSAYRPTLPLSRITLPKLRSAADNFGADPADDTLVKTDPVVREFCAASARLGSEASLNKPVEELLPEESAAK
jgi:hypothetical protein